MPKQRKTFNLPEPRHAKDLDIEGLIKIVKAMNYLHDEAAEKQINEIADIIEAALSIVAVAYRLLPLEILLPEEADVLKFPSRAGPHNVRDLENIVTAMDFLARKAETIRAPDASVVIASAFKILCASYYCILRYNMLELVANGQ
jgi:hypothetical protein